MRGLRKWTIPSIYLVEKRFESATASALTDRVLTVDILNSRIHYGAPVRIARRNNDATVKIGPAGKSAMDLRCPSHRHSYVEVNIKGFIDMNALKVVESAARSWDQPGRRF